MQITVKPSDYTKWVYDELKRDREEYGYFDRVTHDWGKCRLTSLEFHTLFGRRADELCWDRSGGGFHYLKSCVLPRKILKALYYTKNDVVLQDEEVTTWVNFVAMTDNAYHKYSTSKQDMCINET